MTSKIKVRMLVSGFAISMFSALPVFAEDSNIYINGSLGLQNFDHDRNIKSEGAIILGIEKRYANQWGAEIFYMDSSPEGRNNSGDIDLTQFGIDGIYHFKSTSDQTERFQPYGAVGLGHAKFKNSLGTDDETQVRTGLGLRYLLNDHWSVKTDARLIYSGEAKALDTLVSVGLSYAFNSQLKKAAPVAAIEPEPELDTDGDGVRDANDQCSNTPAGVIVDSSGCALDSDQDSVVDHKDECLQTPTGATVDAKGCALDTDADGVADYKDNCPNTPAGRQVDEKGCKYVLTSTEEVTLKINFASNSNVVTAEHLSEIEKVANFLKKYSDVNTVIEGHTDDRGADSYNTVLSQGRAEAVMNILIDRYGIEADRVSALGYGESRPVTSNATKSGRLENRRVVAVMKAQISN